MPGQLWLLIQAHIDAQPSPPSDCEVARQMGVHTSVFSRWRHGQSPHLKHMPAIARVTGQPLETVAMAAIADAAEKDQPRR